MKTIGQEYMVTVGKKPNGVLVKAPMTLEKIEEYKGQTIYVFDDDISKFVSYEYKIIDWKFLNEINKKFLGVGISDMY